MIHHAPRRIPIYWTHVRIGMLSGCHACLLNRWPLRNVSLARLGAWPCPFLPYRGIFRAKLLETHVQRSIFDANRDLVNDYRRSVKNSAAMIGPVRFVPLFPFGLRRLAT
jgi:hypothetical protein